ncbi:MAG: permease [Eubacteriales bacterium]
MLEKQNTKQIGKKILIAVFFLIIIAWVNIRINVDVESSAVMETARGFTLILWSVLLEALPFVMLGTVISSLIQEFVTEEMILKVLPKSNVLRLIFSAMLGLVFPVCECAIIPITRGLMKKGMPTGPAIAFMIATPIINPIVLLSTYNAFPTMPQMVLYRGVIGFVGAILIGALVNSASREKTLKEGVDISCACGHDGHHHACEHGDSDVHEKKSALKTFVSVLSHTSSELKSVGMYLIFGAIISAAVQILVPTDVLTSIGSGRVVSILVMMALAFVLSICSEADAFIGSTFMFQFSSASVLAFLVIGPMVDIKNTIMMLGAFKKKFVLRLIITIFVVCLLLVLAASYLMGGNYA